MSRRRALVPLALAAVLAALVVPAAVGFHEQQEWEDDGHSHDKARRAVERGDALPLAEVLRHLRARFAGDVVATEYEFEFERWVYEFRLIDPAGRLRKIHLDAATGDVIKVSDD